MSGFEHIRNLREAGNAAYKRAMVAGVAPVIKRGRLMEAANIYRKALALNQKDDETASVYKNAGMALSRIASTYTSMIDAQVRLDHVIQALQMFTSATQLGSAVGKEDSWVQTVTDAANMCSKDTIGALFTETEFNAFNSLSLSELHRNLNGCQRCSLRAYINVQVGIIYFNQGLLLFDSEINGAALCLSRMVDCQQFFEAARYDMSSDPILALETQVQVYGDRITLQRCLCESRQQLLEGDRLLNLQMSEHEQPDQDMVWDIVDRYKHAAMLTRERDLEGEAGAICRLANVFYKVFKMDDYTKLYYGQALDLADAMHPADMSQKDWHIEATQVLALFNLKLGGEENCDWEAEKPKIREELSVQLSAMKKLAESDCSRVKRIRDLLQHLYDNYPPKDPRQTLGSTLPEDLKKTLMAAITHYHPDKQHKWKTFRGVRWGDLTYKKWVVLCGEATAHLNALYGATYKGGM